MEFSHKRRGFMKVKVPSFGSRAPKSPSIPLHPHSSKVRPSSGQSQYNAAAAASVDYFVKQDVAPQVVKKVTFVVPIKADEGRYDTINRDTYFGAIADEYANMKASNYILSVKERFRLERLTSERRVSQEIGSLAS